MINNYIKEKLVANNVNTANDFINVIREETQKIILYSLSKTDFFNHAAFYGGTCLRIFHNLNRYSEDLDFNVLNENENISLDKYMDRIVNDLEAFGFKPDIKTKEQYDTGDIRRRYVIIPIYELAFEYFGRALFNKEQNISVKIEVSVQYSIGATYERKLLNSPLFATILCFDYPSLFAGKIHALLVRNWLNREKGRDYYDYMFYLSNGIKYNLPYLQSKLINSSTIDNKELTNDEVKEMLFKRFSDTNYEMVKKDVLTFVINPSDLDSINKESFSLSTDLLENNR